MEGRMRKTIEDGFEAVMKEIKAKAKPSEEEEEDAAIRAMEEILPFESPKQVLDFFNEGEGHAKRVKTLKVYLMRIRKTTMCGFAGYIREIFTAIMSPAMCAIHQWSPLRTKNSQVTTP